MIVQNTIRSVDNISAFPPYHPSQPAKTDENTYSRKVAGHKEWNRFSDFIFSFSSVPYLVLSPDSTILQINKAGEEFFQAPCCELKNSSFRSFLLSGEKHLTDNLISEALHSRTGKKTEAILQINGNNFPVVLNLNVIPDSADCLLEVSAAAGYTRRNGEVTPEINRKDEVKDKFFSIVAHDLKNPFNSIMGFSELLLKNMQHYQSADIARFIGIIHETSQRTYHFLENLLLWSRSQSGTIEYNPALHQLNAVVYEVIESFGPEAEKKKIVLELTEKDTISAFLDKNMIETVIRNLLSNAVKYSYPESTVNVSVFQSKEGGCVSVCDSGTGIEPEYASRLFQPDKKFSLPGTAHERGSGLGLLICKEFADRHGGNILLESEPGKGSVFTLVLPAA